ncbi:winged helix-turn-helix domain-containing protein [Pseudodonghicola flavimaris]|uniref:LysR family transcriptional regulator n=1 Tax=Pseudodonghicola flavimaris TaxID=3050036 RepID=A0ABT7EZ20_9RHOB|nr:LysR family transcriptional regulator [Pseudodonghicola flavimaris]MDK3017595.1 LysR family transcriptional regulator [Pseudodonghicola flavimaris]
MPDPSPELPRLRLRLIFASGEKLGPGKADLLALIAESGSISAAGRSMGMSYKRAWSLVEEMNAMFTTPLVQSVRGGAKGGGARLTDTGEQILQHYRALERATTEGGAAEITAIAALRPPGAGKPPPDSDMSE